MRARWRNDSAMPVPAGMGGGSSDCSGEIEANSRFPLWPSRQTHFIGLLFVSRELRLPVFASFGMVAAPMARAAAEVFPSPLFLVGGKLSSAHPPRYRPHRQSVGRPGPAGPSLCASISGRAECQPENRATWWPIRSSGQEPGLPTAVQQRLLPPPAVLEC